GIFCWIDGVQGVHCFAVDGPFAQHVPRATHLCFSCLLRKDFGDRVHLFVWVRAGLSSLSLLHGLTGATPGKVRPPLHLAKDSPPLEFPGRFLSALCRGVRPGPGPRCRCYSPGGGWQAGWCVATVSTTACPGHEPPPGRQGRRPRRIEWLHPTR